MDSPTTPNPRTGFLSGRRAIVMVIAIVTVVALGIGAAVWMIDDDRDRDPRSDSGRDGDRSSLSGEREGPLTVSDGPQGRDLYAYALFDFHGVTVVVMDGSEQVASVPVTYSQDEYHFQLNDDWAWSTDGRWFALHDDRALRVVDTEDGTVQERPCEDPGESDSRWCPGSVAVWGDRVVTFDQLWDWEGTGSDLVVSPAYDLDTTELLSDSEPDSVQWQRLAVAGDRLLASGSDTSRTGEGYRGNDPTVMYAFTRDGSAERMDWVDEVTWAASVPATFEGRTSDGLEAVVVTEGSGGACVHGYSFDLIDPDVPTTPKLPVDDGMFALDGVDMAQESGTIHDIWFGRDGELYATASSIVCPHGLDESEVGTPLSTWHLDDGEWVATGDEGLWTARDLPSGARLTLVADELPDPDDTTPLKVGTLGWKHEGDTTMVSDSAIGLSTPPLHGDAESSTGTGDHDDSEAYRTKCGSPPTFTPVEATNDTGGVTITYEVRAVCPGGQWLNWSQLRVPLVVDGVHWADGWFDYASTPYWIPEDGTRHRLTYPYGQLQVPYGDIANAIDNRVEVITVPCEPGPDNDDDAPVPSSPTTPADDDSLVSSGDTATDEELQESALEALRRIAAEDADAVEALNWTAQLSSKKPGTRDDGIVYDTYDKILELHLRHRSRYPQSLLVWSGDWPGSYGESSNDYWVTLSGDSHDAGEDVLDWCDSEGWGAGDCWAKRLARSGEPTDNTLHPKED